MKGKFQPYVDIERPRDMTELLQLIKDKKITPLNANYDFKTWSGGVPTGWEFIELPPVPHNELTYSLAQVDDGMEITFTKEEGPFWPNLIINSADNFTYLANRKYVVVVDYTVTEGQNLAYYSQIKSATQSSDFTRCGLGYLFNVGSFNIPLNFRTQLPSLIVQYPYNTTTPTPVCKMEFYDSTTCDPLKVVIHSMGLYDVTDFVGEPEPNFFIPDLKPK